MYQVFIMGIYTSGIIYGIRMYTLDDDRNSVIIYEVKQDAVMDRDRLRETKLFYGGLNENDKSDVNFQIYTTCSTTYDHDGLDDNCKIWDRIPLSLFLQKCG